MAFYYYIKDGQELGPFTIDELKEKRLRKTTLFWTEGLEDWTTGESIQELDRVLVAAPPTIIASEKDKQRELVKKIRAYDPTYKREFDATYYGILFIIAQFLYLIFRNDYFSEELQNEIFIGVLVLRIVIIIWVIKIAKRQNRSPITWGIISLFIPSVSLIIIGLLKKRKFSYKLKPNIPLKTQINILHYEVDKLFNERRFSECIEILNGIIEVDSKEYSSIKQRGYIYYKLKDYENAEKDLILLKKNEQYKDFADQYLQKINERQ